MHRLSSVTKHPKTSSKLINSRTSNIQRDQGHRRRFPSHTERAASCHGIDSGMGNRNWSCVYKNACQGGLISQMFFRSASYFHVHPEKLKQVIKERDGQTLCSYYDSDIYKMKAVGMVEEQNRVLDEGTPQNMKDTVVTYEHMLNCAQPHQKPKVIVVRDIEEQEDVEDKEDSKTDILSFWRKKRASKGKNLSFNDERSPQTQNAKKAKGDVSVKDNKKKYRKRTTILPLYLKKIQNNAAIKEKITDSNPPHETKLETELSNTRKRIAITKSEYRYRQGEKPQDVQKLLKEKVLSADHQNEAISRIKPNSKYSEGSEEDRHWYQNSKASSKFDAGCREIKDFNPGKKN